MKYLKGLGYFLGFRELNFGNCICILEFNVGALLYQVYDCVKSVDSFNTLLSAECFSCFFLSQANMADFEIITFNVKGLGSFKKRRKVFNYLKKHTNANAIAFLQETHSTERSETIWIVVK